MNCENCQELLSDYIDNQLDEKKMARMKAHLMLCRSCEEVYEDFSKILGLCNLEITEEIPPPNEQALWCRINNIIECEIKPETTQEVKPQEIHQNWVSRMWNRNWSLSFTQVASAVMGIALISSLLTIVGIRNLMPIDNLTADVSNQTTFFDRVLSKVGLAETTQQVLERRLRERQLAIEYWNNRVAVRRAQWDNRMREVFDRNLREIDQVVFEYSRTLEANPQDELSVEMLDTAMDEKVQLLREFSEL